ncbi:tudor domain-containing protein [Aureococcus anophagefferens]|nr:tudor domain-containing protein [Aureococcus anophagefferens]
MGAAHVLPERIDADTARALVGNDRLYKAILPRAPWAVQKFRAGESISRNEARAIWEREKFDGAPRASEQYVASHELPLRARYDTSTFADREDYERAVAKLERRLFEALSELKALRPLRSEALQVPILRGKLRRSSEECEILAENVARLERRLTEARLDVDRYRRDEGSAVAALTRRCEALEQRLAAGGGRESPAESQRPRIRPERVAAGERRRDAAGARATSQGHDGADGAVEPRGGVAGGHASLADLTRFVAKQREALGLPAKAPAAFAVGARVEARYKGKGKYYPGTVSAYDGDGTYAVDYDDGEQEKGVAEELIRGVESKPEKASAGGSGGAFLKGAAVEARYRGKSQFYPGKIARDNGDGTYDIDYDDGEKESKVAEALIRGVESKPEKSGGSGGAFPEGAKVEARYRGKGKFYPGKIAKDQGDGTYDIDYDDGEKESKVAEALIRGVESKPEKSGGSGGAFPEGAAGDGTYDIDYDDGEQEKGVAEALIRGVESKTEKPSAGGSGGAFPVGGAIEARYRGKGKFYPGKIAKDNGDGTYDVDYDDGEKESNGGAVEARYRGKGKYYPGKIAKDNADGTYDVDYDDGEKEKGVAARYRGKGKYYPGKIARDNGDGTYDIDYDDGEQEKGVTEELIRGVESKPEKASAGGSGGAFPKGAAVEARYRGKSKFYPGKIARDNGDGTYDIDYDDGEKESKVAEALIRGVESKPEKSGGSGGAFAEGAKRTKRVAEALIRGVESKPEKSGSARFRGAAVEARYRGKGKYARAKLPRTTATGLMTSTTTTARRVKVAEALIRGGESKPSKRRRGGAFPKGAAIEARYRGKSKYYPGKIAKDNGDGTYDIDYDDGESEKKVAEALIRGGASSRRSRARAARAARSQGRRDRSALPGKSKWYPGKIGRDNGGGTYDIDYDDGEQEKGVEEALIRGGASKPSKPSAGGSGGAFPKGAKVEARYRGKSKWYPGKIARDNGDGTYDIDYDDGESEKKVAEELIRGGAATSGSGGAFAVGAEVEARYRGKSKYYPGKIAKDNGDGTYNIDYDDGEKESDVAEALIKASAATGSGGAFKVGDKIEGRYRGKSKWYPGKIAKDNGDGTYDLDYDDGESETGVAEALIREALCPEPLVPPLVDVRAFHDAYAGADGEAARAKAAAEAAQACRSHGLLALPAYGGIDAAVVDAAFESVEALFALPLEKKLELEYRDVRENVGYIRLGNESPDPRQAAPDPKEVFQFQPGKRKLRPPSSGPSRRSSGTASRRARRRSAASRAPSGALTEAWRGVVPPAGAADVFVNIGDMLARRTNDELCSTWHRVVAPADAAEAARPRFVIALFVDADSASPLAALPQFVSPERPAKYAPISAGDFKAMRLAGQTTTDQ